MFRAHGTLHTLPVTDMYYFCYGHSAFHMGIRKYQGWLRGSEAEAEPGVLVGVRTLSWTEHVCEVLVRRTRLSRSSYVAHTHCKARRHLEG